MWKKNSKSYQDRHLSFFTPYNSPHKLKLCTFCAPIPLMLCYKRPVRAVLKIFSTACVKNNILYILQLVWLNYFTLVTNGTQETILDFQLLTTKRQKSSSYLDWNCVKDGGQVPQVHLTRSCDQNDRPRVQAA